MSDVPNKKMAGNPPIPANVDGDEEKPFTDLAESQTGTSTEESSFLDDDPSQGDRDGQPLKRRRRVQHESAELFERHIRPLLEKAIRRGRWMYLLTLRKDDIHKVIEACGIKDEDSYEFSVLRVHLMDNIKLWKSRTLDKLMVSILIGVESGFLTLNRPRSRT